MDENNNILLKIETPIPVIKIVEDNVLSLNNNENIVNQIRNENENINISSQTYNTVNNDNLEQIVVESIPITKNTDIPITSTATINIPIKTADIPTIIIGQEVIKSIPKPKRNQMKAIIIDPFENHDGCVKIKKSSRDRSGSAGDVVFGKKPVLTSQKEPEENPPHTYFVAKSNGWKLVKAALDKRGWQQLPFEYQFSSRFSLKWVERRSQIDYRAHVPGQLVSHIPNNDVITTKIDLVKTLRAKYCKQKKDGSFVSNRIPFIPDTFLLENENEIEEVRIIEEELLKSNKSPALWIYKPSANNRGHGIKVVTGKDQLDEIFFGKKQGKEYIIEPSKGIIQRYVTDPLLIGEQGYKFDIRCYMLVARTEPKFLMFYHPGYCRLSLKPYSTDISTITDLSMHLTNASVQKKDEAYNESVKEFQIQSIAGVADQFEKLGNQASADYFRNRLDVDIKKCMLNVSRATITKFTRKHGYFDLLGFDFIVTKENKLLLLEVNTNPALSLDNSTLENLLPGVVDGAIELVLASQGPDRGVLNLNTLDEEDNKFLDNLPPGYQFLYNENAPVTTLTIETTIETEIS